MASQAVCREWPNMRTISSGFVFILFSILNPCGFAQPIQSPTLTPGISGRDFLEMGYAIQKVKGDDPAERYFKKAREEGNAEGEYLMVLRDRLPHGAKAGDLFATSRMVLINQQKEFFDQLLEITLRSAKQGNVQAENRLWVFYSQVQPYTKAPPDMREARKWLKLAADQGDPEAEDMMGQVCEHRPRVLIEPDQLKDMALSRHWYELAARQGNGDAWKAICRSDTEKMPLELTGFIGASQDRAAGLAQSLQLQMPMTLGGVSVGAIPLNPSQTLKTYMPYATITGNLHWLGEKPTINVRSVHFIKDHGSHLVDYLNPNQNFYPDQIQITFSDDTPQTLIRGLISKMGTADWTRMTPGGIYTLKLNPEITMKEALTELVERPEITNINFISKLNWGFE